MEAERLALKAAEALVELAEKDASVLLGSEPCKLMLPCIEDLGHRDFIRVSELLFERLNASLAAWPQESCQAPFRQLLGDADESLLPQLKRLDKCISKHNAFQSAASLTPLMQRVLMLASQCCGLILRDPADMAAAVAPLTQVMVVLSEVLEKGVTQRVESFLPIDAQVLCWAHQALVECQAELQSVMSAQLFGDRINVIRKLCAQPVKPGHGKWNSNELRILWESKMSTRYGQSVPADALAVFLLKAASLDVTIAHREAVMRRLSRLDCQQKGYVTCAEIDTCAAELRRIGGLRPWVLSLTDVDETQNSRALDVRSTAPLAPSKSPGVFSVGSQVRIFGLQRRPDLNGKLGTVVELTESDGRWKIQMMDDSFLMIKTENLQEWTTTSHAQQREVPSAVTAADQPAASARPTLNYASVPPLGSTWGSFSAASERQPAAGALGRHMAASTMRSTSSFTPRSARGDRKNLFALSGTLGSRRGGQEQDSKAAGGHLHEAVERSSLKASQKLILGDRTALDTKHGTFYETALHHAASRDPGHAPIASLLLDRGADANSEDKYRATPLHVAASSGHKEVARKLIRYGANVQKSDRWSVTPLHRAAMNGQKEVAELLLQGGASADAADEWGSTPLHRAAAKGQLVVAERLVASFHADVDAQDRCGERPIHLAARNGDYALVKLFLEHGCDPLAQSRTTGKTPEQLARERGHTNIMTLLQHRNEWVQVQSKSLVTTGKKASPGVSAY